MKDDMFPPFTASRTASNLLLQACRDCSTEHSVHRSVQQLSLSGAATGRYSAVSSGG